MKLNPTKYSFEVSARKFLGFIIIQHGIDGNLEKIQAILDMLPPSKTKEVQELTERVAALERFVPRSIEGY